MREIKFRGKGTLSDEWIYGSLLVDNRKNHYTPQMLWYGEDNGYNSCLVEPKTIGQFTGLLDKNGKEIYEGDIVDNGHTVVYADNSTRRFSNTGTVKYDIKNGCLVIDNSNGYTNRLTEKTIKENKITVIGNIHEGVDA